MAIKRICDWCDAEIIVGFVLTLANQSPGQFLALDLCDSCADAIRKTLTTKKDDGAR